MRKFFIALIFFLIPAVVFAAGNSASDKLIEIEQDTYGAEQPGAILNRLNRLEKDYTGKNMQGNMNVRIDALYEIIYGNSGEPSVLAKINALEWNMAHEVSGDGVMNRVGRLESEIAGTIGDGSIISRIKNLSKASFGSENIPMIEMQIPSDILIRAALTETIGSRNLQVGDTVNFKIVENIELDGKLLFAKGLRGVGVVKSVKRAKGWTGRNGKVQIDFYSLKCIDGRNLEIYIGDSAKNEMVAQKMVVGAYLVGMNLNDDWNKFMVRGKNVEIGADTEFYVQNRNSATIYCLNTRGKVELSDED